MHVKGSVAVAAESQGAPNVKKMASAVRTLLFESFEWTKNMRSSCRLQRVAAKGAAKPRLQVQMRPPQALAPDP